MPDERWFDVEVACAADGGSHGHHLRVASAEDLGRAGLPGGSAVAGPRQVEYVCPVSGEARTARFVPPAGFDWPFRVLSVQ